MTVVVSSNGSTDPPGELQINLLRIRQQRRLTVLSMFLLSRLDQDSLGFWSIRSLSRLAEAAHGVVISTRASLVGSRDSPEQRCLPNHDQSKSPKRVELDIRNEPSNGKGVEGVVGSETWGRC